MDRDQFFKLVRSGNRGKPTVLCQMQNAFVDLIDEGPVLQVYAFPGTQRETQDGPSLVVYLPQMKKSTYVPIEMLSPIKKTKAPMLDRLEEFERFEKEMQKDQRLMIDCLEKIGEADDLLARAFLALLNGMENLNSMNDRVYSDAKTLLETCREAIGEDPFLSKMEEVLESYKAYTSHRDEKFEQMQEVSETLNDFREKAEIPGKDVASLSENEQEKLKEVVSELMEENGLDPEEMSHVVHVRVVTTSMLAACEEHEYFTEDEVIAAVKKYRSELLSMPEEVLLGGIRNGLRCGQEGIGKITPGGLIEKNVMDLYSLTEEGRSFAYFTMQNM